jgi:hypothetical protein
MAASLSRL